MKSTTPSAYVPGVLIVDDDPRVRSMVREALTAQARVFEAADTEQAIELLDEKASAALDLVLLDYVLPKGSGLDVLALTKRRWPWLPVVIITGFGSEELAVNALRGGARDYLRKPVDITTLRHTVHTLTTASGKMPYIRTRRSQIHPNIAKSLAFVEEHFAEPITLTDVARAAAFSRFHFCRLFHHGTGMSFREYLQHVRVTRAKALLTARSLTVTDVAYSVGFNDLSHFDRIFRRIAGHSPSEYRRLARCA